LVKNFDDVLRRFGTVPDRDRRANKRTDGQVFCDGIGQSLKKRAWRHGRAWKMKIRAWKNQDPWFNFYKNIYAFLHKYPVSVDRDS